MTFVWGWPFIFLVLLFTVLQQHFFNVCVKRKGRLLMRIKWMSACIGWTSLFSRLSSVTLVHSVTRACLDVIEFRKLLCNLVVAHMINTFQNKQSESRVCIVLSSSHILWKWRFTHIRNAPLPASLTAPYETRSQTSFQHLDLFWTSHLNSL